MFGDPYEADGCTVIPVAKVAGGAGGGGGEGNKADESGTGYGTGFGLQARPVGVYVVRDGEVAWKPAIDVTRLAKGGQALVALLAVCVTLIAVVRRSRSFRGVRRGRSRTPRTAWLRIDRRGGHERSTSGNLCALQAWAGGRIKGEQRDETTSILDQRHARRLLSSRGRAPPGRGVDALLDR